ncbi:MAG: hypothetical protein R3253_17510, partial [Longimicrobiales bacterium]|nr:hypothetical protein [Longimicrobiales bacterium]
PAGEGDVWIKELDEGPEVRVTSRGGEERPAAWLDGETLLVLMSGDTGLDAYAVRADGAGEPRLLYDHATSIADASISRDATSMAFTTGIQRFSPEGPVGGDLYSVSLTDPGTVQRLLETRGYSAGGVALHPDGAYLAYHASPTRRIEVFVRPFPDIEAGRSQISVSGGIGPHWSADGSKLYYVSAQREMTEAELSPGSPVRVTRRRLFTLSHDFASGARTAPDGSFLMARSEPALVLVFDWQEMLR